MAQSATSMEPQLKVVGKRLLFVDDEPGIRQTLSLILLRYGFSVILAASVQQALEQLYAHEFDLLLCDLNIEGEGDGYKVVQATRKLHPNCINIILTGYPGIESAVNGTRESIDDYLVKPANADALVALLAEKLVERNVKGWEHLAPPALAGNPCKY